MCVTLTFNGKENRGELDDNLMYFSMPVEHIWSKGVLISTKGSLDPSQVSPKNKSRTSFNRRRGHASVALVKTCKELKNYKQLLICCFSFSKYLSILKNVVECWIQTFVRSVMLGEVITFLRNVISCRIRKVYIQQCVTGNKNS